MTAQNPRNLMGWCIGLCQTSEKFEEPHYDDVSAASRLRRRRAAGLHG